VADWLTRCGLALQFVSLWLVTPQIIGEQRIDSGINHLSQELFRVRLELRNPLPNFRFDLVKGLLLLAPLVLLFRFRPRWAGGLLGFLIGFGLVFGVLIAIRAAAFCGTYVLSALGDLTKRMVSSSRSYLLLGAFLFTVGFAMLFTATFMSLTPAANFAKQLRQTQEPDSSGPVAHAAHGATGIAVIVGKPSTGHAKEEVIGAIIVVVIAILLIAIRHFGAAVREGRGVRSSLLFAVWPWTSKPSVKRPGVPRTYGLLVGADGRTSTSKTAVALWTGIVVFFFIVMALVLGFDRSHFDTLIGGASPIYLIFLAGPFAAAVLAKAMVTNAVSNGTLQKSFAESARAADVVRNDVGLTDLVDLQYIVFSLVVAGSVLVEFLRNPAGGPPPVQLFFAGLITASAVTYIVNKALETVRGNSPSIDQVIPSDARPGAEVVAYGNNFAPGRLSYVDRPVIIVGGNRCPTTDTPPTPDRATFRLPATIALGQFFVELTTPSGVMTSSPSQLTVVADSMTISMLGGRYARPGGSITLFGQGFYNAESVDSSGRPVSPNEKPAQVFLTEQGRPAGVGVHRCMVQPGATDTKMTVAIPPNIMGDATSTVFDLLARRGNLEARLPEGGPYIHITRLQ
jgi:hypothetical protein